MFGFGSVAHHKWKKTNRVKQWIVAAFHKIYKAVVHDRREFKQSRNLFKRLLPKKLTSVRIKVDQHNLWVA